MCLSVEQWVPGDIVLLQDVSVCRTMGTGGHSAATGCLSVEHWVPVDRVLPQGVCLSVEHWVPVDRVLLQGVCQINSCSTDRSVAAATQIRFSPTHRMYKPQRRQPSHNTHYAAGFYFRGRASDVAPELPTTHPSWALIAAVSCIRGTSAPRQPPCCCCTVLLL